MTVSMRHICVFLVVVLLQLSVSPLVCGKTVYVSSTEGNDANNGFSKEYPLKSIKESLSKADTVLLKAGDVFYEEIRLRGKFLGRYGNGRNPEVRGFRCLPYGLWQKFGENLWQIDLDDKRISGIYVEDDPRLNNIGGFYENSIDVNHGRKVQYQHELVEDWDFWQTEKHSKDVARDDFRTLTLYLKTDPNLLSLDLISGLTAMNVENSTIDGVNFKGFGFGLSAGSNTTIRNSHIDVIGGRTFLGYPSFICYGNGIEFYVGQTISDCLVEDCYVSRCYDCGITIQGSKSGKATPKNIKIRNNLISNCCQGWEDFLRNDDDVFYEDCVVSNNIFTDSGNSGFGYPKGRFKYCHILGNNNRPDLGLRIENNTFIGGNFYCGGSSTEGYKSNIWVKNKCYIEKGNYLLGNYDGSCDVIRVLSTNSVFSQSISRTSELKQYRSKTSDLDTEFIMKSDQAINRLKKIIVEVFLSNHLF